MAKKTGKKRGPPPGILRDAPIYPEKVLAVVRMRLERKTFAEIADAIGGTRMNACNTYKRWKHWGLRELGAGPSSPPPGGSRSYSAAAA